MSPPDPSSSPQPPTPDDQPAPRAAAAPPSSSPLPEDPKALADLIAQRSSWVGGLREEMGRVVIGQENLIDRLLVGLLTSGHILLEGVPGIAKTLTIRSLAGCLDATFSRIQFTPDLLPADVLGTLIYNPGENEFKPKLGAIFANLVLADEINRAPAKVQSALLEAMQERQVTLGDTTYDLPSPFLVLATQNPIDQEGTYRLPEAQMDRFLLKVAVDYPSKAEERQVLDLMSTSAPPPATRAVMTTADLAASREVVNAIYIDDIVKDYIVELITTTRDTSAVSPDLKNLIRCGASPRGTINLTLAARANAFLKGRGYVIPQDIKDLAPDVLRHRILLSYEAEAEGVSSEEIIARILEGVPVPLMPRQKGTTSALPTLDDRPQPPSISEILRRVRRIEFATKGLVEETLAGDYHTSFKGQGIDFDEFREYQAGDEVRSIDWNVTARMGSPYVKTFVEDRELTVFLVVDVSASGDYGGEERSKRDFLAEVAAALAFSAIRNQDKVGLILFSDHVELFLPAKRGAGHILRLIREVIAWEPQGTGTDLAPPLDVLTKVLDRKSLVFLLSDFQAPGLNDALRIPSVRHDLVAVQITDPHEEVLPKSGPVIIEDPETGEMLRINPSDRSARATYEAQRHRWQEALEGELRNLSVDHVRVCTDTDYLPALHSFFRRRAKHPH